MENINSEFRIIFQPKQPELFGCRRRFAIGGKSVNKYLGEKRALTAILKAYASREDRYTKVFRTLGRIDFYVK